jgi:hypothetical protein
MKMIRDALIEEIKNTPQNLLDELYDYLLFLKEKESENRQPHFDSERVLARDWNSPEEEKAWKNL